MDVSPLLAKPDLTSRFNLRRREEYMAAVAERVYQSFCSRWPWTSDRQKEVYSQQDTEHWSLMSCPRAPEDRAEVAGEYLVFYFAYDDFLDDLPQNEAVKAAAGTKRILLEGHPPQNAIESMLYDIRSRMLSLSSDHNLEVLHAMFEDTTKYLDVTLDRDTRRKIMEVGKLDDYLKYRFVDIGYVFSILSFAWESDIGFPQAHIKSDPDFDMLINLGGHLFTMFNDMYSYRREALWAKGWAQTSDVTKSASAPKEFYVFNCVDILLREDGVDETNVMEKLGMHIRRKESEFIAATERLSMRYGDDKDDIDIIQRWTTVIEECVAGTQQWSAISRRYNKPENFANRE